MFPSIIRLIDYYYNKYYSTIDRKVKFSSIRMTGYSTAGNRKRGWGGILGTII